VSRWFSRRLRLDGVFDNDGGGVDGGEIPFAVILFDDKSDGILSPIITLGEGFVAVFFSIRLIPTDGLTRVSDCSLSLASDAAKSKLPVDALPMCVIFLDLFRAELLSLFEIFPSLGCRLF
jgi:hypothetical protein